MAKNQIDRIAEMMGISRRKRVGFEIETGAFGGENLSEIAEADLKPKHGKKAENLNSDAAKIALKNRSVPATRQTHAKIALKGTPDPHAPWFGAIDGEPSVIVPAGLFEAIIESLRRAQKEAFELKLERSILQQLPVDFGDVWSVALSEIRGQNLTREPDLDRLVARIKKEHPNLFVNMENLIQKGPQNG